VKWEKLGRIFEANGQRPWIASHSSVPTPEHIRDDLFRIYFSPRDTKGRSNISFITVDLKEPGRILDICEAPSLAPGEIGAFDDSGAMFSWIVRRGGQRWLYYIGWNVGTVTPWRTAIGLAFCDEDAETPVFVRHSDGPILDRSTKDPYLVTSPCIIVENDLWRMWYISGLPWQLALPRPLPRYHVCYAESRDGINWTPTGRVCVPHAHEGEVAISRPSILRDNDVYKMWFSYRGDTFDYRMGYAESPDGLAWTRFDHAAGLELSASGWDSKTTAYPLVFDHGGRRYMLYCGNGYSKAGFGLAVLAAS
jgi:hypothetical protein